MTNEEAKQVLSCSSIQQFCLFSVCIGEKVLSAKEALDMAIKALEQDPICPSAGIDCEDCPACEDAISRQAVLDLAKKGVLISNDNYKSVCKAINELPPVNPTKTGHWLMPDKEYSSKIWRKCSCCGTHIEKYSKHISFDGEVHYIPYRLNYCYVCGTRMVEPQESETGMSEEISREEIAALLARESEEQDADSD